MGGGEQSDGSVPALVAVPVVAGPPSLVEVVVAEQAASTPACGQAQPDVDGNVCVRDEGHDGPHVGSVDGVLLQWEV